VLPEFVETEARRVVDSVFRVFDAAPAPPSTAASRSFDLLDDAANRARKAKSRARQAAYRRRQRNGIMSIS
jgi:hypothetical protein